MEGTFVNLGKYSNKIKMMK